LPAMRLTRFFRTNSIGSIRITDSRASRFAKSRRPTAMLDPAASRSMWRSWSAENPTPLSSAIRSLARATRSSTKSILHSPPW